MAENENTITLVGRIGQEPELRATPKGDVCNFTVATSERRRAADGSWFDAATSWFRVAAWNDLGRHAHASLRRGQQVVVHGVLTIAEFQTGNGRGKNAEVRATALGHDLRWGITTYTDQREVDRARSAAQLQPQAAEVTPTAAAPTAAAPEAERRPVAAGGDWSTSYADETPF
jgi:single-strand DNA-binding protein